MSKPDIWHLPPCLAIPPPSNNTLESVAEWRNYSNEYKKCHNEMMAVIYSAQEDGRPTKKMKAKYRELKEVHESLCRYLRGLENIRSSHASEQDLEHLRVIEKIVKKTTNTSLHKLVLPEGLSEKSFLGYFIQAKDSYRIMWYFFGRNDDKKYRTWLANYQKLCDNHDRKVKHESESRRITTVLFYDAQLPSPLSQPLDPDVSSAAVSDSKAYRSAINSIKKGFDDSECKEWQKKQ